MSLGFKVTPNHILSKPVQWFSNESVTHTQSYFRIYDVSMDESHFIITVQLYYYKKIYLHDSNSFSSCLLGTATPSSFTTLITLSLLNFYNNKLSMLSNIVLFFHYAAFCQNSSITSQDKTTLHFFYSFKFFPLFSI